MILKKGLFSDLDILEICGHISREEYEQELSGRIETQITENQNTLNPCSVTIMLTQDRKNWRVDEEIMAEKKISLQSLRNQAKVESKKDKQIINKYPNRQHHELIYAGAKSVFGKIDIPQGNPKKNAKPRL